jgi:tetratricopeptide (TPR) repeat protein
MRLLAEIGVRLGALEEAHFVLESACELQPDDPRLRIDYHPCTEQATALRRRPWRRRSSCWPAPDNLQYQSLHAIELLQLGRYEEAIAAFDADPRAPAR